MTAKTLPRVFSKLSIRLMLLAAAAFVLAGRTGVGPFVQAQVNLIAQENNQAGSPASEWDVNGAGDESIQGFATDISVNTGQTVQFKIKTVSANYRIDIIDSATTRAQAPGWSPPTWCLPQACRRRSRPARSTAPPA